MTCTVLISDIPLAIRKKLSISDNFKKHEKIELFANLSKNKNLESKATDKKKFNEPKFFVKDGKTYVVQDGSLNALLKKGIPQKEFTYEEAKKYMFKGDPKNGNNLATTYKDYLYGNKSKWAK